MIDKNPDISFAAFLVTLVRSRKDHGSLKRVPRKKFRHLCLNHGMSKFLRCFCFLSRFSVFCPASLMRPRDAVIFHLNPGEAG